MTLVRLIKSSSILIFILLLFPAFASASMTIQYYNYKYDSFQKWHSVNVNVCNSGSTLEYGAVELAVQQTSNFQAIIGQQDACDVYTPYNVIRPYILDPNECAGFSLYATGIPSGTYYPVLVHVTGCCTDGVNALPCSAKEPVGWGEKLTSVPITFGNPDANIDDECNTDYEALEFVREHGDPNCAEAECENQYDLDSTAVCVEQGECVNNAVQKQTCADGSIIDVRVCNQGYWQETGATCAGEPIPQVPPPNPSINWAFWLIIIVVVAAIILIARKTGVVKFK